jgi:hypothetical protein
MVKAPTARETGEVIIEVLVKDLGLQPGGRVPDQALKARFKERGRDQNEMNEIAVGLKYAHNQDWLRYEEAEESFVLTQVGFDAA